MGDGGQIRAGQRKQERVQERGRKREGNMNRERRRRQDKKTSVCKRKKVK